MGLTVELKERFEKIETAQEEWNNWVDSINLDENGFIINEEGESIGYEGFIDNALIKVDSLVTGSISYVIEFFETTNIKLENGENFKTTTEDLKFLFKNKSKIDDIVNNLKYDPAKVKGSHIPILEGLAVTLPTMNEELNGISILVERHKKIFANFEKSIYKILEGKNHDVKKNLPKKSELEAVNGYVSTAKSVLSKFTDDSRRDVEKVYKVMPMLKEMPTLIDSILVTGRTLNFETLKEVSKGSSEVTTHTKLLVETMVKSDTVSKKDLKELGEYIGVMAQYVTTIGLVFYSFSQLTLMTKEITELIKK